jgi:hypothetical protein
MSCTSSVLLLGPPDLSRCPSNVTWYSRLPGEWWYAIRQDDRCGLAGITSTRRHGSVTFRTVSDE